MWEKIKESTEHNVTSERMRVVGGWIVRSHMYSSWGNTIHQIFIEDREHQWILN